MMRKPLKSAAPVTGGALLALLALNFSISRSANLNGHFKQDFFNAKPLIFNETHIGVS